VRITWRQLMGDPQAVTARLRPVLGMS